MSYSHHHYEGHHQSLETSQVTDLKIGGEKLNPSGNPNFMSLRTQLRECHYPTQPSLPEQDKSSPRGVQILTGVFKPQIM